MKKKKKKQAKARKKPTFKPKDARPRPVAGFLLLAVAVLTLVALLDYSPEQFHTTDAEDNLVGKFGVYFAVYSYQLVGLSALLMPLYLLWGSYMYFFSERHKVDKIKIGAIVLGLVSSAGFFDALDISNLNLDKFTNGSGGYFGGLLFSDLLEDGLGHFGGFLILITLFVTSTGVILSDNLGKNIISPRKLFDSFKTRMREKAALKKEAGQAKKEIEKTEAAKEKASKPKLEPEPVKASETKAVPAPKAAPKLIKKTDTPKAKEKIDDGPVSEEELEPDIGGSDYLTSFGSGKKSSKAGKEDKKMKPGGLKIIAGEETRKAKVPLPEKRGDYLFPPLKLLKDVPVLPESTSEDHQYTAHTLERILAEFGVKVTLGEIHTGPVITRYDVHPAAGVRVEKIINLDKNIALGLKATSVRILAPVPGKGCVGIEVPNKTAVTVTIREILESTSWAESKAEIPIALGREVSGKPLVADLSKMPHLLIAGSTGSGKTVCINAIITSLLFHSSPEDVRFVMVDPKIVEMQFFNDLPHMLIPVVTDPKKVPGALKYLLGEMEKRYHIFAKEGVRNIASFNAKRAKDKSAVEAAKFQESDMTPEERAAVSQVVVKRDDDIEIPNKLPYIVCIVDELADLMMVAPADIETCVARLAQLARAAGIHLIIATQRPSVNVITGVIKANLPSRIAFKVASKVDSRTILDSMGADHLIGNGDMLFLPPGSADMVRSQGAYVADEEIKNIVDFLKQNGPPDIDEMFHQTVEAGTEEDGGEGGLDEDQDKLMPQAIEVLRTTKRASTSMLQRRLKIGYNRAARIMEQLEDNGIVGPDNGSKPREILIDPDML